MQNGWIKLYRSIEDNIFYLSEKFTRAQAWIDLLLLSNHKDNAMDIRGNLIQVKRGQIGWSKEALAKRWKWSRKKVLGFLKTLETTQQITQQKTAAVSLITIVNYEKYQGNDTTEDTTEEQQKNNRRHTNKNDKNVKNEKKGIADEKISSEPTPAEIAEEFFSKGEIYTHVLRGIVEKGNSQEAAVIELDKFIDYWTEPTKSGKTCRWKQQKTFEIRRRLSTWFRNAEKSHSRASPTSQWQQDRDKFFELQRMQRESMTY